MRTFLTAIFITCACAFIFSACGSSDQKAKEAAADVPQQPIKASANSAALNQSFETLLNDYYSLKDALVASDTSKANLAATALTKSSDSLKTDEIKDDSAHSLRSTAQNFAMTINGSAKGLIGESTLEAKRKEFQMISDALYDLTRTIRYDKQKVYHSFCPMAFNDAGAYWLSNSSDIQNPYFGKKMLTCGEVKDSLNF